MGRVWGHRTWSHFRSNALRDCPRGFFFRYCSEGEPDARDAKLLKSLGTSRMEAGSIVHDLILSAMRSYREDGELVGSLADEGERLYRERSMRSVEVCEHMRLKRRFPNGCGKRAPFVHHYHRHDLGSDHDEEMVLRIRRCLDHFDCSDLWAYLRGVGCERWEQLPDGTFDGMPKFVTGKNVEVFANWDFVGTDPDGVVHVVDWKTGRASDVAQAKARIQLCVYASWAARVMGVPLHKVRVHAAFLLESPPEFSPSIVHAEERQALAERVHSDVAQEAELIEHRTNKVGRIYGRWACRESFLPAPAERMCKQCGWLEMCPEGQAMCDHIPVRPNVLLN